MVTELAQGKASTADSEETSKSNVAPNGNDGDETTRWCAANGAAGHYWTVDLGAVRQLSRVELMWEFARQYGYVIAASTDNASYQTLVDRTDSTDASQMQTVPVSGQGRYVRITVSLLPDTNTWACLYEVRVFGQ